ncbi:MAG TPA: hypothetical protein VE338_09375 [Ktedonobacterales bacterium]|jgi:hypothetical protein|nr:hypothetical protein [Ktedonobacterales bacterium]
MDRQDDQPAPPANNPAPEPAAAEPASAERQLELALRMLAQQSHASPANLRLLPGQAPADLPFTLPLPPGARIVGSMTGAEPQNAPPAVTILVDAPLSPEQSVGFYVDALQAANWTQEVMPHMRGGFVHVQPGGFTFLNFHSASDDQHLTITTLPGADERQTTLSIVVRKEQRPGWQRSGMGAGSRGGMRGDMETLIPPLLPPPGASQQGGGGGGGMGRWQSNAQTQTELPVAELIAHYDGQLERGGWRRRDGGASGPVGWSFWAFADSEGEPWRGKLLALNSPDRPHDYLLLIQIEAENQHDQQGGHFVSSFTSSSISSSISSQKGG